MIDRVVFMGTPPFAVPALRALAGKFKIVGVYTQPDRAVGRGLQSTPSAVKKAALELGIPVYQPEKLSAPGEFEKLSSLKPSVIVVVAYGQILKKNVLQLPPHGCVNIHSSLLPRWRGAAPIHWALLSGDQETGVTTMKMDEGLDTGPILLQSRTQVLPLDTAESLHDRLAKLGADLIVPTLTGLSEGTLAAVAQSEAQVTYASKLTKEMGGLGSEDPAVVLERKVRALNPWPGAWIELADGRKLRVKEACVRPDISGVTGTLYERNGMILLSTAKGSLELKKVQWEGKTPVGPVEFLNGLKGRGESLPLKLKSKPI